MAHAVETKQDLIEQLETPLGHLLESMVPGSEVDNSQEELVYYEHYAKIWISLKFLTHGELRGLREDGKLEEFVREQLTH